MGATHEVSDNQLNELKNICFKIHAIATALEVDRVTGDESATLGSWEGSMTHVVSRLAETIQEQVESWLLAVSCG